MSSIDDRIVNMQFNNSQFQQGIGQTNASLEQLKQNLNLDGATAGIDNVQSAANRFSLANIESAIENVSSKFSIFGAVGFTVLQDLTNTVINTGKNIASALIDPLVQGGATRALAIQQAQFQFQGLGLNIADTMAAATQAVTGTAYSLDQAATAAAELGASGVTVSNGLEPTLRAIAGVAAQTGGSFQSVANIFETVAGNGRLMGEQLLQFSDAGVNAAAVLAKSMGISEASVRTMVSQGKISFAQFRDAMNDAFGANAAKANELFTGALANMHAALARIGADFASPFFLGARDIFNSLSPLFDKIHKALGPLITDFTNFVEVTSAAGVDGITNLLGPGIVASIQNLIQAFESLKTIIGNGFHEIFPDNTPAILTSISVWMQKITAALIPGTVAAGELQRTFAGIFALFNIAGTIIGSFLSTIFTLFGYTSDVGGSFLEITARLGDFLVKVDQAIQKGQVFQTFFKGLGAILAVPIGIFKTLFGILADGISVFNTGFNTKNLDDFADDISKRFGALNQLALIFQGFWSGVVSVAKAVWNFLEPIFVAIGNVFAPLVDKIGNSLRTLNFNDVLQTLNSALLGGILIIVERFFSYLTGTLSGNEFSIVDSLKAIFIGLRVNLKALAISVNAKTLLTIAEAVAVLAASAVALSFVDSKKMVLALSSMTIFVVGLLQAFKAFSTLEGTKGILQSLALSVSIEGIATAILILAAAVAIMGALPLANLIQGILGVTVVLIALVATLKSLEDLGPEVLASAGAIAILAPAMAVLAGAIAIFGALPLANLVQGVLAFAVVLAVLVGALVLMDKLLDPVVLVASAVSIGIIAGALAILTGAVAALGALPLVNLAKGVIAFVVILAALVGALALLDLLGPTVLLGALAIGLVALSLIPLIGAIAIFGALPLSNLIQGIVGLAAVLLVMAAVMLILGLAGPATLIGAAALIIMAVALAVIAPAFKLLSTISWDGIGRGITALAAALVVLAIGGVLLIPASIGFLLFGAAMLLFGTGLQAAGEGALLLAAGIAIMVAVGAGGIALMGLAIDEFVKKLPSLGIGFGAAFVSMVVEIGSQAPKLVNAFVQILLSMLQAVDKVVPEIIKVATDIISALINAFTILIPELINMGITIIKALITGIANNIGQITSSGIDIVVNYVNAISNNMQKIIDAGGNLVLSVINGIADYIKNNSSKFIAAGTKLFNAIVDGISKAIEVGGTLLREAGQKIGNALIVGAENALKINSPSKVFSEDIMPSVFEGIEVGNTKNLSRAEDAGTAIGDSLTTSAITSVKNAVSGISTALDTNMDMSPTIRPVLDISDIQNKAKQISGLLPTPTLSVSTSTDVATSVALQEQDKNAVLSAQAEIDSKTGNTVNFTQNNNSPVALSTPEIYRQTKNQLSTLKGELGVVDQTGSPQ